MATVAGSIKSLSNGIFHVKDENGNVRELKVGDEIHENDTIYGDSANSASSKVEIQLSGNDVIVLSEGQKQLIDSSLIETAFGTEELFFTKDGLDLKADNHNSDADVVSDLRDAEFNGDNNKDITEEATAEGKKEAEDETTVTGEFQARDGNATDIVSDLRNAQFKARTQVFEDKSAFESESKDRLSSLENTDRPSYTTPTVIQITPSTPPVQQVVTPPPPAAPIIVIGNLSVNDITQYESEGFLIFTVTLDRPVASPVTFDYKTSPITASPNGKDYTDVFGKIIIPAGSTSVTIKVPIIDDYVSDNGETIKITITNVVGNATITKPEGIGTILDNPVNNPGNGTPNTPKEPGGYGEEDTVYAIIVGPGTVNEGDITTDYTVKLIDKDGNPVIVTKDTNVTVKYLNIDTEDNDTQYKNNDKITVTIKAGTSSNTFKVETKDDYISDNNEKYNLSIEKVNTNEFENVVIGDKIGNFKDVTTTILDNTNGTPATPTTPLVPHNPYDIPNNPVENLDTITVRLFAIDAKTGARVPANEVFEGNNAEYIAVAFDKNGNEVLQGETVTVTFGKAGDTATQNGVDYVSTTQTVIIGTKFNTPTVDDYIADNGEKFSVQITDKTLSNASKYETIVIDTTSVTTTIIDDSKPNTPNNPNDGVEPNMESVTVKLVSTDINGNIIDPVTIPEGATAYYKAILVDPSGNQIVGATGTVEITFKDGTAVRTGTTANGTDDFTATNQIVTLNTVFSAVANDDYIADNGETFNVQITDKTYSKASDYENVIHITTPIVTTIIDNSKPNTPNDLTDDTVEGKDIVTIKLFAIDPATGLVAKDASGNYLLANNADEGTSAKYIAYAFKDGTTTFNDTTRAELPQVGKVNVTFNNASATGVTTTQTANDGSQDFDNLGQTIIIGESFETAVFKDILTESGEKYTVTITTGTYAPHTNGGYESVTIDTTAVTTTIKDSATPLKVFVKIEAVTNSVNESADLEYKVSLVDVNGNLVTVPAGKSITVNLTYANVTTSDGDYTRPTTQVTITGGSSTNFKVPTVDDYYAEGNEVLGITISNITGDVTGATRVFEEVLLHTNANGAPGDKVEVTGTIKDNPASDTVNPKTPNEPTDPNNPSGGNSYGPEDTVYVKLTKDDSVVEGNTLTHTVTLVDKDGTPIVVPIGETITVTFQYSADTTENKDFKDSTKTTTVTITGGNSTAIVSNITIDDFIEENPNEIYTLTIINVAQSNGTFENVAIHATEKTATGEIKDGIILGNPVNAKVYEDGLNTSATTENDLGKSLGITKPNGDTYTVSFDKTIVNCPNTSNGKAITYSYNTDGTLLTATRAGDNKTVFTVELKKDGSGNDVYDFKLIEPMDHEYGNNGKNTFDMPFKFNVTSNGTTSTNQTFNVTVVDSVPSATPIIVDTKEDTAITIRLADDDFKVGETVTINGVAHSIGATGIAIYEQGDTTKQIGSLTINSNGTVTFTPSVDYSNYDTTKSPQFSYTVKDFDGDEATSTVTINVKPVADAPTIFVKDITTTEDAGNTQEGTNKVNLELKVPFLSKDSDATAQTSPSGYTAKQNSNITVANPTLDGTGDYNTSLTGDNPERNGEITLTFTNGDKVNGAKIFNGATEIATVNSANQTLKIVIVTVSGDSSTIDYSYHNSDITALNPSGTNVLYLTKAEYEALQIQHAEDNDTDIKIEIGVTSYEVDDSGKPLDTATYGNQVESETTANMTVKINPVTDGFTLNWDGTTNSQVQSVDTGTKTIVFNNIQEYNPNPQSGPVVDTSIDLKALLTNTSGSSSVGGTDTSLDLDGSEKRSYTIKLTAGLNTELPEYIYITIGDKTDVKVYKDGNDEYTIAFDDATNKISDPDFSMKFPDYWSGKVTGTITLTSQDKGVDSTDTAGVKESDSVNFEVTVQPVAQLATIQVAQSVGYEDAGRTDGNSSTPNNTIDNPSAGIPFNIKVSSDDKDGSETFNVKIEDIPNGSSLYVFDKSLNGGIGDWVLVDKDFVSSGNITVTQSAGKYEVVIKDYQNDKLSKFIPAHNDDTDYTLKVSSQTVDNNGTTTDTSAWTATKNIDVIVKNVADAPVGIALDTNINVDEDNKLNLKDIYVDSTLLASSDSSEELTVKIALPAGFTVDSGGPYYIEDGMYVVKASDIKDGKILINVPENFSGSASFDLTYVTTEKAGENDSKTWAKETVNIFVNPISDDVTVAASSTINEDADGSANKIDLKATLKDTGTTNGTETIDSVKILASTVPAGYELFLGSANGTSIASKLVGGYYVLTSAEADSVYAKNTTADDLNSVTSFPLTVVYTVKDTNGTVTNTDEFTHTHTVNVKAVTDAPAIAIGDITTSDNIIINNTTDTVTVKEENSSFKVPVTTTSPDSDGSETVQKIVISGVPMGVSVDGATYYGYSGSVHNGIWEITSLTNAALNTSGLEEITFTVNTGADFSNRDMTITTYTQDTNAEVETATTTIRIEKDYTASGTGTGTPPHFDLSTKAATIYEDNNDGSSAVVYNLGKSIDVANSGGSASGNYAITITDFPTGTTVSGASYSYVEGGKTYYVITGTGNAADVETKLSTVIVTPPTDMNTGGAKDGQMTFSATISTYDGGTFAKGTGIVNADPSLPGYTNDILAVTDAMTVAITADNIYEDGTSDLSITLSNPSDGTKTELVGNSLTITVTETWADAVTGGGTKGTLTDSSGKYNVVLNGDGTYTITPLLPANNFTVGNAITGLQYTPASNRDGSVKFDVSVQNKETGSSVTLNSAGDKTITVTPVIDAVINTSTVIATGTEDQVISGIALANPVKLEIEAAALPDGSEKFGNIILDEVPNGFTVWYKVGGTLEMATNIGTTGGTDFDLTPNITGDANVTRNKWLVPATADGSMPEVYINAPTNWSGDFDFDAIISVKEQNLATSTAIKVDVTGHIDAVADGVTIAPTLTFGDAFSWVSLNLNANMKDIDGSETMSLELTGLDESAQFRLNDGTALTAVYESNTWKINGITFNQINNIQFSHDKSVSNVEVIAKTVDNDGTDISVRTTVKDSFELKLSDLTGDFKLDKGVSLDFNKIGDIANSVTTLKGINSIDLSEEGSNKLLNLSLQDVLDMSGSSKEIKITGIAEDEVSFKNEVGKTWSKVAGTGSDLGFDVYSNSNDSSVKVKVEQNITDHII